MLSNKSRRRFLTEMISRLAYSVRPVLPVVTLNCFRRRVGFLHGKPRPPAAIEIISLYIRINLRYCQGLFAVYSTKIGNQHGQMAIWQRPGRNNVIRGGNKAKKES